MAKSNKKSTALLTLDLHGLKEDEVFDKVDKFLSSPRVQKASKARIMSGKGKGIVQKKLIEYLKLGGYPWTFERDAQGRENQGVLVIHLD